MEKPEVSLVEHTALVWRMTLPYSVISGLRLGRNDGREVSDVFLKELADLVSLLSREVNRRFGFRGWPGRFGALFVRQFYKLLGECDWLVGLRFECLALNLGLSHGFCNLCKRLLLLRGFIDLLLLSWHKVILLNHRFINDFKLRSFELALVLPWLVLC